MDDSIEREKDTECVFNSVVAIDELFNGKVFIEVEYHDGDGINDDCNKFNAVLKEANSDNYGKTFLLVAVSISSIFNLGREIY